MKTHHSVPTLLAAAEAEFSARLRASSMEGETGSRGLSLYRKIVRENIAGVLQRVFPLFCRRFNDAGIHDLANAFLYQHHASQPEFHQIATELLLFIRQQGRMSPRDLALLEYEWLMYAVEIDDSDVPLPQKMTLRPDEINHIEVMPNPTLKMIALPFQIKEGEPCYEDAPLLHYYVIYRKNNNALYQKKLSQVDVQLLSEVNSQIIAANLLRDKILLLFPDMPLQPWLEASNNDELLFLKSKR